MTPAVKSTEETIYHRLRQLLSEAYAPYSGFRVAAAALDETGVAHYGVNVENQSLPVGVCAEAGAITALRVAGGKRIKKIYLLSEPNIEVVPCGACRQRIAEFADPDTQIITFTKKGETIVHPLDRLFPHAFRYK
jgi:cytidine deaminase